MNTHELISVTVIGDPEILSAVRRGAEEEGSYRCSVPLENLSPADVLNSPLNPHDVVEVLQTMKVLFETGTAGVAFLTALLGFIRLRPGKKVQLRDARTGADIATLEASTSLQQAKEKLGL